jgi:hypothetical protein
VSCSIAENAAQADQGSMLWLLSLTLDPLWQKIGVLFCNF